MFVLTANDVVSVVAIHAVLRLGALVMVAPTSAGGAQVRDIVAATEPSLVLAPESLSRCRRRVPAGYALAAIDDAIGARRSGRHRGARSGRDPDEPSVVIFTSGTTSRPKGVVHSLNTMLAATRNFVGAAELTAADNIFMISPLASVTGMMQATTVAPWLGAQVTVESRFDDVATFDFLVATGGDLLRRTRSPARPRARPGRGPWCHRRADHVVFLGGSMLDPRILARAEHEYGIVVLRAYGSSEAPVSHRERTAGAGSRPPRPTTAHRSPASRCASGRRPIPPSAASAVPHLFLGYVDPDDDAQRVRRRLVPAPATSPSCATDG